MIKYNTAYEVAKLLNICRRSIIHICNYLNISFKDELTHTGKIRKTISEDEINQIKEFLILHPYPKTFFTEQTCIEKYGVKNVYLIDKIRKKALLNANTQEAKDKRALTNIERYGCECPFLREDIREQTLLAINSPEAIEKCKATKLEKYGSEKYNNREQYKETCIGRYGVESYSQTQEFSNLMSLKYNDKDFVSNRSQKMKETCIGRYNVNCCLQLPEIKEKIKQVHIENKEKIQQNREATNLAKYGEKYFQYTEAFRHTAKKKYLYENIMFDSSWELAFYIYLKDLGNLIIYLPDIKFSYIFNEKLCYYYPDFLLDDLLIEIKGDHFFKNDKMINPFNNSQNDKYNAKYQCGLLNNVKFLTRRDLLPVLNYINITYGKNYLKKFKNNNNEN